MAAKRNKPEKIGAALVIGGGIAGIQASLDLAESGQKVYLLEHSPAIGGHMARLDKTFPTNDCSMCILSPKIVECGRHLNIETITWADLEGVSGEAGNFTVAIRKRARFVDVTKCTGCGECAEACPIRTANEFDGGIGERKAVFRPCPQAYPNAFVIDKHGRSPCRVGCPAGININAYVALTAAGRYDEALDAVLDAAPLPGVLGRVCHHPCETECHLSRFGDAVSICAIKRFLADRRRIGGGARAASKPEQAREKVAIVGSGPAGLAAARSLARQGYRPTIFEAATRAGGMLAWGIPDYRLPPDVLEADIRDVLEEGVELRLGVRFGSDVTWAALREQGFKALIMAVGAQAGAGLGVEVEALDGVTDAIAFLRGVNSGEIARVGRYVTVIGGGNSAIDSARTALRLGAERVTVVYRRSRAEMPAIPFEILAAEQEGVQFHFLAAPVRFHGADGKLSGMTCLRMRLGEPDASGRRRPETVPGSEFEIETDMAIAAIGQKVEMPEDAGLADTALTRWGTFDADGQTGAAGAPGVFAAGDAVTGPGSVIGAIAEGKKAAQAVDSFLRGAPFEPPERVARESVASDLPAPDGAHPVAPRQHGPELSLETRLRGFGEVEGALTEEQAIAEAKRCLHCAMCSECMACVEACKAQAILHDQQDEIVHVKVGAIVAVPGFEDYPAAREYDFGYSRFPDVVSSIEFERILSASGPFSGHVRRLSDGSDPKRIAFLQCVGSRDVSCRHRYCSSVCCMYAIKEAVIAKEHMNGVEVTVFFMDLRAFGKDFDKYCERAQSEYGVRFVRARPGSVSKDDRTGRLVVRYAPEAGPVTDESFDMVVLSAGLEPPARARRLAERLGIRTDADGFFAADPLHTQRTSRPGVFAGGAAAGPKDIPETVVQASAAACEAGRLLHEARGTLTQEREYPPERDVALEPVRTGVFVCQCGINIGGVVHVPSVAEFARALPSVVYAEDNLYTCSQDTQDHIRETILEHRLNRVVVASCSPRTHEALFQETLRQAGLNPHLFAMANIRDQCSWVHQNEPDAATAKAKDLVRMAAAKARLAEPLSAVVLPLNKRALVVGGGFAGLTGALAVADQGFEVCLVERDRALGGRLRGRRSLPGLPNIRERLAALTKAVLAHPRIEVRLNTTVREIRGFVGNYETALSDNTVCEHGAILVATGADEIRPAHRYGHGQSKRIVTQTQFDDILDAGLDAGTKTVVMIQCVGSREEPRNYCSRVCCARAVRNAIRVKERNPDANVIVLYRDIRTYGRRELDYADARDKGVLFVRFDPDTRPEVTVANGSKRSRAIPTVAFNDPLLERRVEMPADYLVLSTGMAADRDANDALAKQLKVPINQDGFFMEAHAKLRPVEFATEGVYLAGLAHGPKATEESAAQALAAASRMCALLSQEALAAHGTVSAVNAERCAACGLCETMCAFQAIGMEMQRVGREERLLPKVNLALCKGCGVCAASCRCGAMALRGSTDEQVVAEIMAL